MSPPLLLGRIHVDEEETEKATTEDVYFTRNLSLAGVPNYVNWDSWAGHVKRKVVGKPTLLTADSVRESFREAVMANRRANERLTFIEPGPELNGHLARRLAEIKG